MIYAIPTIALLLILCAWMYAITVDALRERNRARRLYADAMRALADRHADIDDRDAEISRLRRTQARPAGERNGLYEYKAVRQ